MTKKVLVSTILFFIIFFLIYFSINKKDKILPVFNDEKIYGSYEIDVSINSITTRNIKEFIADEIDAVYPYFDIKYSSIIKSRWFNIDKTISFENNMERFEEEYINILNNNSLKIKALDIKLEGIRIARIRIITDDINKYRNYAYTKKN